MEVDIVQRIVLVDQSAFEGSAAHEVLQTVEHEAETVLGDDFGVVKEFDEVEGGLPGGEQRLRLSTQLVDPVRSGGLDGKSLSYEVLGGLGDQLLVDLVDDPLRVNYPAVCLLPLLFLSLEILLML